MPGLDGDGSSGAGKKNQSEGEQRPQRDHVQKSPRKLQTNEINNENHK